MRIALATCETLPDLFTDDQLLREALAVRGAEAHPLVWDSAAGATDRPDLCVLRNTWDYYLKAEAFLAWAEAMAGRTRLLNPWPLVRWNAHKAYLLELATRKVPTVPTLLARRGRPLPVAALAAAAGWTEVVVKPAVSAGAHRTARHAAADPAAQAHLEALVAEGDALIQPYLVGVEGYGERSFLVIDGQLTHGVRRPQALREGVALDRTLERVTPTDLEAERVRLALVALPAEPLYARIDLVPGLDGSPVVMEVEVIEPRLFLQECPEALERFADALVREARR